MTNRLTGTDWIQILLPAMMLAAVGSLAESWGLLSKGGTFIFIIIACFWSYVERIRILNNLKNK